MSGADRTARETRGGTGGPEEGADRETLRIRSLRREDAGAVAVLEQEIFGTPWSKEQVEASIGPGGESVGCGSNLRHEAFGAYAGGTLCGYLLAVAMSGEGELHRIAVAPAFRRKHVGDALMEEFLCRCWDCGEGGLWLEVRAGNRAAAALYRKHGFREAGRRKRYYQNPVEDALVYTTSPG